MNHFVNHLNYTISGYFCFMNHLKGDAIFLNMIIYDLKQNEILNLHIVVFDDFNHII